MLDIPRIASEALAQVDRLLPAWLPGGQQQGRHWVCGSIKGEPGTSLKVAMDEGCFVDYASGDKGGDLVALYAKIHGIGNGEAAKRLAEELRIDVAKPATSRPKPAPKPSSIGKPPADAGEPDMRGAAMAWCYRDADGMPLHWVARYNGADGSKDIKPYCWDTEAGRWVCKGWPGLRPLYGLDLLAQAPTAPVMVVEGEKAAEAARKLVGGAYVVVTWSGGAKATSKADWAPLKGRKLVLWPDADEPGVAAMQAVAQVLAADCPEVKIIDVAGMPDGFDAADWTNGWDALIAWAKPRAKVWQPAQPEPTPTAEELEQHMPSADHETTPGHFSSWSDLGLAMTDKGKLIVGLLNAERALTRWEGVRGLFWFDEFYGQIMRRGRKGEDPRPWTDADTLELTALMQDRLAMTSFGDELWFKAVSLVAKRNTRNEPLDWIKGLTWDGTPRIADFLTDCMGVEGTAYTRAASRNFWISLVARASRPGCKVDTMLILEGGQGKKKSSALAAIVGPRWHTEATESVTSKDFYMILKGKLIVEIAELDSFGKAEATKVKQVITNRVDTYRAPYGRIAEDHPRRCVFAGTTNESHYLRDSTGGRRFWPVRVGDVDLDSIRAMREQCFAEAWAELCRGSTWWEMPESETRDAQESRRSIDPWEDVIRGWLGDRDEVSPQSLYLDCIGLDIARQGRAEQLRVAACMQALGWESKVVGRSGYSRRMWRKK